MSNSLAWYYREIGHRIVREGHMGRCTWCGVRVRNITNEQRRRNAPNVVRVCIDRQAMLFSPIKSSVKYGLGWIEQKHWCARFRS
jgi:hypothetical protein